MSNRAFLLGLTKGKDIVWKVGIVGLNTSILSSFFSVWDLNRSIEGGWANYGSPVGLTITIVIETVVVMVLTYLGGYLKEKFIDK